MADRVVLQADHEVVPLLVQMQLDRDLLIEILRVAAGERALCTGNDVRGFDLIMMNDKVVRGLRDAFCGPKWRRDETDNQEGIRNDELNLRVIACNFDRHTANPLNDPTNLSPKGAASSKKAHCNGTAWLPGLPDPHAESDADFSTWVLGSYVDEEGALKGELSHPKSFTGRQYRRFNKRIVLLTGSEGTAPIPARKPADRDGPVEVVDIDVRRR